jgi:PAS domain S-box-containing protein
VTARRQAEEEQRRRSERAQLLSETLALLLGAGDPEVIVRDLFPKVAAQLGVEIYLNFMVEEPGDTLRLHAFAGLDEKTASVLGRLEVGQAICGTVAEMRRPVVANGIQQSDDPRAAAVRKLGIQAYACNPLVVGDRLLGTLSFGSRVRSAFDADEIEFLGVVAQYSAVALDRLRTTRELKARTRTLEVLNRIGATLSGELDPERLVQAVTDAGREVTGAAFGAFFYNAQDAKGESYMLSTLSDVPKSAFEKFRPPRNTRVFAATFSGAGVVRIGDARKDRRYGRMGPHFGLPKGHPPLRSYLAAPVISRSGEVLGGLFFGHSEPNVFTEEAEHILSGIAAQAAIAMDNARLYDNVQKTADRLSLSISSANLGDFTWDAATDRIILSPRTAEIYGVNADENLTRTKMRDLLAEEDQPRSRIALERSIETKTDYDIEYRVNRPDGVQRWVAAKGRPYYSADGRVIGMVGVVQDITAHKHAEAVSEAKRKVLHLLAEGAALESVLAELVRAVELEAERRIKGSILLVEDDRATLRHGAGPRLPAAIIQACQCIPIGPTSGACGAAAFTKEPVYVADIETDPLFSSFKELALAHGLRSCWSTPIFSSDGEVLGAFAIYYAEPRELRHEDMAIVETATRTAAVAIQRRRNERALRESEARQRQLLSGLPVACYTMDADGRLTFFNDAAERLWGRIPKFEKELWVGSFGAAVEGGKRVPLDDGPAALAVKERRSVRGLEGFIMRPDGSRRWVVPHPDPLFDAAGNCIGVINVIVDVTEERHAKRMLQEAKETAEAASAAKDRFLAVLSHELRTPLTPVLMTVASLESDPSLPKPIQEDMAMIRRNVELETKLIDDLLDLSRITTGKLRLRLQAVDLNEAVRQVCGICHSQILEKGIRLSCHLDSPVGFVAADPARLQQVLWNVLKNAAKFTPKGGEIHVTTRAEESRRIVEVRDSGIGIAPEMLPRIFDAFEQGEGITRQFGGLGLGLAISKALIELHGGAIRVRSEGRNMGATFVIEVPARAPDAEVTPPEPREAPEWERAHLRLLVVEDHVDTARTLSRILRAAGFSVTTANNVTSALELAEKESFDVLLSDIGLPDGTGYDLLHEVRKHRPVQAIAMSGFGMDEDLRKSREAGFSEHLVKPVHVPELLEALRRLRS